ncbi:MAG: hypothetical protein AMXMBFR82_42800 [Candidatus Hydrogenedentota bacterium]
MQRIKRISRVPYSTNRVPAIAFWEGDALTRFQTCHFHATTKREKKDCYETFQSEKTAEKQ